MSSQMNLSVLASKTNLPVGTNTHVHLMIELTPGQMLSNVRLPLNFCLVLDHSGSMGGEKIRTMREAVKSLIDEMDSNDVLSIIIFDSDTEVLVPATFVTDKTALKRKVDSIRDRGGTTMAPGIRRGLEEVSKYLDPGRVSRILLLTDGQATDREDDSRREVVNAAGRSVPVICLGFGSEGDWDAEFIQELADLSVGSEAGSRQGYADHIPSPEKVMGVFNDALSSMMVVAKNAELVVHMVEGVEALEAYQAIPVIRKLNATVLQGRNTVIPIGEVDQSGMTFLVSLNIPARNPGQMRAAQVDVTFEVPGQGVLRESVDIIVNFTTDAPLARQVNQKVMHWLERVQAFKDQTRALELAANGDHANATILLRRAGETLKLQGEVELGQNLIQAAQQMEQQGDVEAGLGKTIKLEGRKTQRLQDPDDPGNSKQ
ncbi:MAG: von Willebrand factor type A domain protein [Bacteroidetes bacterium ADurb.Bin416]|nr:MAG: von Willebrand factor type A domain protein [Bacteroidetes bacterium ADurb.Bin416]